MRKEYRFGNTSPWGRYSLRLAKALIAANIPEVQRKLKIWYNDPATAQWEVSFPVEYSSMARNIADNIPFPTGNACRLALKSRDQK